MIRGKYAKIVFETRAVFVYCVNARRAACGKGRGRGCVLFAFASAAPDPFLVEPKHLPVSTAPAQGLNIVRSGANDPRRSCLRRKYPQRKVRRGRRPVLAAATPRAQRAEQPQASAGPAGLGKNRNRRGRPRRRRQRSQCRPAIQQPAPF